MFENLNGLILFEKKIWICMRCVLILQIVSKQRQIILGLVFPALTIHRDSAWLGVCLPGNCNQYKKFYENSFWYISYNHHIILLSWRASLLRAGKLIKWQLKTHRHHKSLFVAYLQINTLGFYVWLSRKWSTFRQLLNL